MVVNIVGQTLIIQEKRKGKVTPSLETYPSPKSMQSRVDELHLRGRISHQKHQHLTEIISRKTELVLSGRKS